MQANWPPLSPLEIRSGYTTPALGAAPAVTNAEIKAFVDQVLAATGSDALKAAKIREAMAQYQVSPERVAVATGYTVQQVYDYLGLQIPNKTSPIVRPTVNPPTTQPASQGAGNLLPLALAAGAFFLLG